MASVQQDLKASGVELTLEPVCFAKWVEQILSDDGIPFTAVYFAPDHINSSQYVQYFGMIDGASWFVRSGLEAPNADETATFKEALASTGEAKTKLYNELGQQM